MQRMAVPGKYNGKKKKLKKKQTNTQSVKVKRKLEKKRDICSYQDKEAEIPFLSTCAR